MNRFELAKVMECFDLEESECYSIGKHRIYHNGSYYVIIEGNVPYELARLISQKYDNNIYKIRVEGNHESKIPTCNVSTYHIDTIEGLVAFLLEVKDYYSNTQECDEKIGSVLNEVYTKILNSVHPDISIYDWMIDRENRKDYFNTILDMKSSIDLKIREKLEQFDNIINPFSKKNLDINNYEFIVRGFSNGEYSWLTLIDKETHISMTTIRQKNGFVIHLDIPAVAHIFLLFIIII